MGLIRLDYNVRMPIERIILEQIYLTTNVHNYKLKKKFGLKFPEFRIRNPDPDYIFSGIFEFFEFLLKMDLS